MRIGIVGASGFVGNRAVEMLHGQDGIEVRPMGRSPSLQQNLFLGLDYRTINAFNVRSLTAAFRGCDVIIQSILGSPGLIRGSITPTYRAAERAGVRRIIYLSSMIVHTSAPASGTTESSPLVERQPFPTHNAKIDAERQLLRLRQRGQVEVVIFRPGIVFGPRSRWVQDLAAQLTQGTAYLINGGQGICNSVYVDNLIHALRLTLTNPAADGEAFFVGDRERVTWFDFYQPFATALGVDLSQLTPVEIPTFQRSQKQQLLGSIRDSVWVQRLLATLPDALKHQTKRFAPKRPVMPVVEARSQPIVTEMMAILQQSPYQLPWTKAQRLLGYEPIVPFQAGCDRSLDWLQNTSYPHLKRSCK